MINTKDTVVIDNIRYDLNDLEKDCWNRLLNGAVKSRDPFHTPCVSTYHDGEVNLRTVVLRKVLIDSRELRFHTDIRSKKWADLKANNSLSALFYDAGSRIQLRVKGKSILHYNNDFTNDAWQKTALSSRRCYLTPASPSSFVEYPTSGLPKHIEEEKFSLEDSEMGKQNFGIVAIHVESLEWLWLNHAGHRRAFFDYKKAISSWMIP